MATVHPLNLLIVVFPKDLSYPQHFFCFSLMTFSLLLHLLSTPMPMTLPFITFFNLKGAPRNSCNRRKEGSLGVTDFWSISDFKLGQRKHGRFQCHQNSIPPSLYNLPHSY